MRMRVNILQKQYMVDNPAAVVHVVHLDCSFFGVWCWVGDLVHVKQQLRLHGMAFTELCWGRREFLPILFLAHGIKPKDMLHETIMEMHGMAFSMTIFRRPSEILW